MNLLIVVGTRPNFIKITQFRRVVDDYPDINLKILHTGQHHDENMSRVFFRQFGFEPDHFLQLNASSPTSQIGEIIMGIEAYAAETKPDLMIVVGDVNSTLAGAIAANKLGIPLAHLESGLRSRDRTMPEEINRIITDQITDHFFVTEKSGEENIIEEKLEGQIHFVGNTMIDTLVAFEQQISSSDVLSRYEIEEKQYGLMTMHRPATVDRREGLETLAALINGITDRFKLVFPIHPRTTKYLKSYGLWKDFKAIDQLILTDPLDYFSFQKLVAKAKLVITDSGGIQEETTFRQIPCLTLRPSTERPSTTQIGSNTLVEFEVGSILSLINQIEQSTYKRGQIPPLWDGKSTERIVKILSELDALV